MCQTGPSWLRQLNILNLKWLFRCVARKKTSQGAPGCCAVGIWSGTLSAYNSPTVILQCVVNWTSEDCDNASMHQNNLNSSFYLLFAYFTSLGILVVTVSRPDVASVIVKPHWQQDMFTFTSRTNQTPHTAEKRKLSHKRFCLLRCMQTFLVLSPVSCPYIYSLSN